MFRSNPHARILIGLLSELPTVLVDEGVVFQATDGAKPTFMLTVDPITHVRTWTPIGGGGGGGGAIPIYIVGRAGAGPLLTSPQFPTIAAAAAQFLADGRNNANPAALYIQPGTYPEDVTLLDGMALTGPTSNFDAPTVTISGTVSAPGTGSATMSNLLISAPAGVGLLSPLGSEMFVSCTNCNINGSAGGIDWQGINELDLFDCITADVSNTGGFLLAYDSELSTVLLGASSGGYEMTRCGFSGLVTVQYDGGQFFECDFTDISGPAMTVAGVLVNLINCRINARAPGVGAYAIMGTGSINMPGTVFDATSGSANSTTIDPAIVVTSNGQTNFLTTQTISADVAITDYGKDMILLDSGGAIVATMLLAYAAIEGHPYYVKNVSKGPQTLAAAVGESFEDGNYSTLTVQSGDTLCLIPVRLGVGFSYWRVISFPVGSQYNPVIGDGTGPVTYQGGTNVPSSTFINPPQFFDQTRIMLAGANAVTLKNTDPTDTTYEFWDTTGSANTFTPDGGLLINGAVSFIANRGIGTAQVIIRIQDAGPGTTGWLAGV